MDEILFAALSFSQIISLIDTPDEARDGGFHYITIVAENFSSSIKVSSFYLKGKILMRSLEKIRSGMNEIIVVSPNSQWVGNLEDSQIIIR